MGWYDRLSVDFMTSHMVNDIVPLNKGLKEQLGKLIKNDHTTLTFSARYGIIYSKTTRCPMLLLAIPEHL